VAFAASHISEKLPLCVRNMAQHFTGTMKLLHSCDRAS